MNTSAMIKGISVGTAVGTMCYVIAKTNTKQRRKMKKKAGNALRMAGAMMEGFSDYFS